MRELKKFEEFIKTNIIKKSFPNKSRADYLQESSIKTYNSIKELINKIGINENNINTIIKESHDAILELIRARLLIDGFSASGIGAHEAEVSYLRKLSFNESDIQFINQLRYFRNGIVYYGKQFDTEYAQKVYNFLKIIYPKLKKLCDTS